MKLDWLDLSALVRPAQGGKKGKAGEGLLQWDSEREKVLQALVQLLQLDIRSLWSLSLVEEEFIRYPADGEPWAEVHYSA